MTMYQEPKHRAGYDPIAEQEHPVANRRRGCTGRRCRMHAPKHRDGNVQYALSDCVYYETNVRGDCGGRVEHVNGQVICETCRNR